MLKSIAVPSPGSILADTFTIDTLPNPAENIDKYARVSDLFGSKRDLVLASSVNDQAFWQPVRPVFAGKVSLARDIVALPLKSPSVMLLEGSVALAVNRKIELSNDRAFPGASFRLKQRTMLGSILGTLQVVNVNLGTPVSIMTGNTVEFTYDMVDGWVQIT